MLKILTSLFGLSSIYSFVMLAVLAGNAIFFQHPEIGPWLENTYVTFGSWLLDGLHLTGGDMVTWLAVLIIGSTMYALLTGVGLKKYQADLVADQTAAVIGKLYHSPDVKNLATLVAELEVEYFNESGSDGSKMSHMRDLITELRGMQNQLQPLEGMQERMTSLQANITETTSLLEGREPELKTLRSKLVSALGDKQLLDDKYGEISTRLSDLAELEEQFALIVARFGDNGVSGTIAQVQSLQTEIAIDVAQIQQLVDDPLGTGTNLEDTISGLRDSLEEIPADEDIQGHLEEMQRIEEETSATRKIIGDADAFLQRIQSLKASVDTLTELDEKIWYVDGDDLESYLQGLARSLEEADQENLSDQVDSIEEIERNLKEATDAIIAAAERLQKKPEAVS